MPRDLTFIETPVELEPWRKALLDAAQYIREHGWCQNSLDDEGGRVCLQGAIWLSGDSRGWSDAKRDASLAVHNHLCDRGYRSSEPGWLVNAEWNDMQDRTADEVTALMERVAMSGLDGAALSRARALKAEAEKP